MRTIAIILLFLFAQAAASPSWAQQRFPIHDCHMHYSADAWSTYTPEQVVALMDRAGVLRALVSSSPDDGTLKLMEYAPMRFLPSLRPYRGKVHSGNWAQDGDTPGYLLERLAKSKYVAIGEFHLNDPADAETPTMKATVEHAAAQGLFLHIHSGAEAVRRVFAYAPMIKILWAHAGMSEPASVVGKMLDKYPNLSAELSFRAGDIDKGGSLDPQWRELLMRHKDRFVIGSDTYVTSRFGEYEALIDAHRAWLAQLPMPVAIAIAFRNASDICAK